jgi:excisionase family DNA binding protein
VEKLWSIEEVADMLGIPTSTLYSWRTKGYGPRGMRIGKYVRFRVEDVEAWVDHLAEKSA